MARKYIDANILFKNITDHHYLIVSYSNSTDYGMFTAGIKQAIDEIPAADVQEVKRGYWIPERDPDENNRIQCFHCSVCDDDFHDIGAFVATKYCPNCGARMDGEENGKN